MRERSFIEEHYNKLKNYRQDVLFDFSVVDQYLAEVICYFYFDVRRDDFIEDILFGSSLSTHSRINILRNIIKREGMLDKKLIDNLERINNIRNKFAHCIMEPYRQNGIRVFTPKKKHVSYDIDKEYNDYQVISVEVYRGLKKLYDEICYGDYVKKKRFRLQEKDIPSEEEKRFEEKIKRC